jgi:pimeloyl-ACP methyl ester carboxylesterase
MAKTLMSTKQQPEDKYISINGLTLHYLDWGGGSDKVLVMLHGITGNGHMWDDFAKQNCREFRILALDQRGHGESEHAKDGYAVTSFASDLLNFVSSLEIKTFDLVGHSLGARNAMSFAGNHSDRLNHTILVDCGPELPMPGAQVTQKRIRSRPLGFRDFKEACDYHEEQNPGRSRQHIENTVKHALRLNWIGKLVWKHDPELYWITTSGGKIEVPYLWEQWGKITCPTLIIRGEHSHVLDANITNKMLSLKPSAKEVNIKNCGHQVPVDQPIQFEQSVLDFLRN